MAKTRFYEAVLLSTRPWAVYFQVENGGAVRPAQNALAQRLPVGSKLLIAETGGRATVIGRRLPEDAP